jgi:acetyl esterase/lipase
MAGKSISFNASSFDTSSLSEETLAFNARLLEITNKTTNWWEVGAPEARRQRREGRSALPAPTLLPSAKSEAIPSRDAARTIPCRSFRPQNGSKPRGVFYHIHGGGWVLSDETFQDPRLQAMADDLSIACVSVGYRKAPEHPFPAGPNDCYDVAEWLVKNAEETYGAKLALIGGESAGGHLSVLTILHLLQHEDPLYREFRFKGALLHFGCYSLEWTPSTHIIGTKPDCMVLTLPIMDQFRKAFLPDFTPEMLRDPRVSPLFADFEKLRGQLPPALFTCGTADALIDDTVLMSTKWIAAGGEAQVLIIPGAAHGYIAFPRGAAGSGTEQGCAAVEAFVREKL